MRYATSHARIRRLLLMMAAIALFAMPYQLLLAGFVQEDLGRAAGAFGALQSFTDIGALVGSVGVVTLTNFERKPLIQWVTGVVSSLGLMSLAIGSAAFGYSGAVAAIILLGLTLTAYQTINNTMLMDEASPEYYGRMISMVMRTFSAGPLMAYPIGAFANSLGVRETLAVEGRWFSD